MKTILIQEQQTEYQIVIPETSTQIERSAAEELQQYLMKATGANLSVLTEDIAVGKAFYVGHTVYAQACGITGKSKEHWIMRMMDGNVILTGGVKATDRGIFYAVAHFLEDVVGVRWWTDTEEDVPSFDMLELEEDFAREGTPAFSYRNIFSHHHYDDFFYEARNRGNVVDDCLEGEVHHESVARLGGALYMGRPGEVHTLNKYFPEDEYYEKYPEWFAWNDAEGRRIPYGHFCLNNEEFCEELIRKLSVYIEEDMEMAAETGVDIPCFYSISLPDRSDGYCECEKCRQQRERGGLSGYALTFVNKIARAVALKYPNVKIETLVYAEYLEAPLDGIIPEKNVIIRLAHVRVDLIHGIHDRGNKRYLRALAAWSDICRKADCELYIWEYMYNMYYDMPLPIANRLGDTFQAFKDYGVSGIFVENQNATASMWELNQYLLMHLCEDPYADTQALTADFMKRFYGAASDYVMAYLEELVRAATEHDFSCFCVIESAHFNYIDASAMLNGMSLLKSAAQAVAGDSVKEFRVAWLQKLLDATLLIKYFDLKHMAQRQGDVFDFDREAIRSRILDTLDKAAVNPYFKGSKHRLEKEKEYISNLVFGEEEKAELPEELVGIDSKDVYQFYFKNLSRHVFNADIFGFSVVEDSEACLGKVARLCREEITIPSIAMRSYVTSRYADKVCPLNIFIQQDDEYVDGLELYREDLVADKYHLYRVGSVSGIQKSGDTIVNIFRTNYEWVSLSGLSVTFPMDACDVYLSMRFTGAMYGGNSEDADAVYLDRAIIVRRS